MKFATVFRYLFGEKGAIEEVARARESIWVGLALVLMAGVARQYDQSFILEAPEKWFLGPGIFSLATGTVLFAFLRIAFLGRFRDGDLPKPPIWEEWKSFMSCYWMTAPIAFLYAVPVERFLSSIETVVANLVLLGVVAAWRVLLMARVVSVVSGAGYGRVVPWVFMFASIELLTVTMVSGGFERRVLRAMAGLEASPEEQLLIRMTGEVRSVVVCLLPVWVVVLCLQTGETIFKPKERLKLRSFFTETRGRLPTGSLVVMFGLWSMASFYPQVEQYNSYRLEQRFRAKDFIGALELLESKGQHAFAPSRPIPPKLNERETYEEMAGVLEADGLVSRRWYSEYFYEKLRQMFLIPPPYYFDGDQSSAVAKIFCFLWASKERQAWVRKNRQIIEEWLIGFESRIDNSSSASKDARECFEDSIKGILNR